MQNYCHRLGDYRASDSVPPTPLGRGIRLRKSRYHSNWNLFCTSRHWDIWEKLSPTALHFYITSKCVYTFTVHLLRIFCSYITAGRQSILLRTSLLRFIQQYGHIYDSPMPSDHDIPMFTSACTTPSSSGSTPCTSRTKPTSTQPGMNL